ncbi:Carbonic anhydrase [Scedosporium apiospermum]|uniref:Carbonic anhydrase n=1 Tax=Pseudallescheria apiosperma TaxID=563466 RepID=A0A084FUR0_PSEDA|nr:Carbonic anhydrase [Scedosporium apiospermum]KEZ38822.1 Carbonic anhydrase [Scedosporium apiospermum]
MLYEGEDKYHYALSSNQAWAGYKAHQNPAFFKNQAVGETPSILWIGCSDSRIPETTILGLQPGDVFVHRNFANIISPTDINTSASLEFAVAHLKVKHIILCGHSSCPASSAALSSASRVGGVLDTWLTPLKAIASSHTEELAAIRDDHSRTVRVAELNVEAGVATLMASWVVRDAIRERGLQVHGCIFDVATGRLRDLGLGTDGIHRGSVNGEEVVRGKHAMLVFRDGGANMTVR